uniref:Uncharacterized protein LOC114344121 n=1 Tax=Diabrotica virgifera virgifera TaxID=50390 RepID=A0A6P7GLI9_DIAVI
MYQNNDGETDATYQIGQNLANFLGNEYIMPPEMKNNIAQQNETVQQLESMLTDLSKCHTNDSNQNLHDYEIEHQSESEVSDIAGTNSNKNSQDENLESIELRNLLKLWNMESLTDHLIGENVFIPVLKVIKRHHIELLMKNFDLGTYILFEHQLENWRESIGLPLVNQCREKAYPFSNPSTSPSTSRMTSRESTPTRFTPYDRPSTSTPEEYVSLADILKTHKGSMLTEYYTKFDKFKEEQRLLLVGLIAGYYEEKSLQLSLSASQRLEQEILERFPTEKLEFYRVGKRGKIYNKYCNMKSSFKSAVIGHVVQTKDGKGKKTRHEKTFEPEDNAESIIRCLKYDNLSIEESDQCWKACSRYRLIEVKKLASTKAIMEAWLFYKSPSGYRLIDMDFKIAFNDNDGLILNWDNRFDTLVNFLSSDGHIKDKKIKGIVENVRNTPDLAESKSLRFKHIQIYRSVHFMLAHVRYKGFDISRQSFVSSDVAAAYGK